jgi:D-psicose/D-tagatose/L-ribulose 3-epimerase
MIKFGAHAFVWIGEWTTDGGNHAIAEAARHGFDMIEIPLLKPDEFDAASHRAALHNAGITAACSLVLPPDAHMPDQPEKARAFLIRALDAMTDLGSTYLGGCIAYHLGAMTGQPPTQQEIDTCVDVLKDVAAEAKQRGIMLALEACNRYETYLYNTLESVRETILATGADNIRIHADTYHMNIEEEGFFLPFIRTADLLDYVHMSESHRGLVGTGTVKWDEVFAGLKAANFDGVLALESFAGINPDLVAATKLWRPTNKPSSVLAGEGIRFLKDGAARFGLI